jgi:hypothetical protein
VVRNASVDVDEIRARFRLPPRKVADEIRISLLYGGRHFLTCGVNQFTDH